MESKNTFSIAVITYNQEYFIDDCLASIRRQTYRPIEIILYDDASSDTSYERLRKWKEQNDDLDVKLVKNNINMGISYTHSEAARIARGEYFKYIAADDFLADNALQKTADFFDHNEHVSCVMSGVFTFRNLQEIHDGRMGKLPDKKEIAFFTKTAKEQFLELIYWNPVAAPGMFFRKAALTKVGYFDPEFKKFEDYHTWIKLTKAGYTISFFPEMLVYWRRHPESVSYSAWDTADVAYKRNELMVIQKYVLPYFRMLPFEHRMHVRTQILYLNAVMKFGVSRKNHKKFRIIKFFDPLWIKRLPQKICGYFTR